MICTLIFYKMNTYYNIKNIKSIILNIKVENFYIYQ